MKKTLQRTIQVILLVIFIALIIMGRPQLWLGLFILGVLASFIFGRVFCGWVCAINTVLIGVTGLKKKLKIKDRKIPEWLKSPITRYAALGIFLVTFIFTLRTGLKLPVLPLVILIGTVLTFLYPEELWHRYLCPYGTILHNSSKTSKKGVEIDSDKCINCGICIRVCPAVAVKKGEKSHEVSIDDCLVCMECIRKCPQNAISYKL